MKKYLLSFIVILSFLSFSAKAQVGFTCDNSIAVTSLPYQTTDDTANYGDTTDVSQGFSCGDWPSGTNYLAGNEVFYSYVADFTGSLTVSMQPLGSQSTNSSLFVYESCANVGVVCLSGLANSNTDARELNLLVFEGQTYKILISSSAATQTVAYKLTIEKNECSPKPDNLGVTNVNTTSAKLTWANTANYSSWQVAIQNEGGAIPFGSGEITTTTASFVKSGLEADTSYQYWVRAECSPGSGTFSQWAGPYVFRTTLCEYANRCNYTFVLSDAGNNGWDGAIMEVRQNGHLMATVGNYYTSGTSWNEISVSLCKNVPFEIVWNVPGTAPEECGLTVKNSFGQVVYVKQSADLPGGTIFEGAAVSCVGPVCQVVPSNIITTQLTATSVSADWTSATAESWDVYFVPSGSPAPNAQTVPTFANVQKPYTIQNIIPNTYYNVYVRANCTEYIKSSWTLGFSVSTIVTCYQPVELNVSDVTTTSAKLNWTRGTFSDNSWEILMIPSLTSTIPTTIPSANPILENGAVLISVTGDNTFKDFTDLPQGASYICYVRTVCSSSDKSYWSDPLVFNTSLCNDSDKCTYKFKLTNATFNSWSGARMQVRQNGIVVATLGSSLINNVNGVNVNLCKNVPFDLYWNIEGTDSVSVGIQIINPFQDIIYTKLPGEGTPLTVLYGSVGNCNPPSCPKPTNLSVTSNTVTSTSAQLSWTESGDASQWEIYLAPEGTLAPVNGTPVNTGMQGYYLADENPFNVTDLEPGICYVYYVRAVCSPNDIGTWTILSPKTFCTKPLNDECSAATTVLANEGTDCTYSVSGTTVGATLSDQQATCTGGKDDDVWYSFVATSSVHVISFSNVTGTSINIDHILYQDNDGCETLVHQYCSDPHTSVAKNLQVGSTYKIRIYTKEVSPPSGINPRNASFDLCITTPTPITNDECSTATNIPVNQSLMNSTTVQGQLTNATASPQVSTCPGVEDDDVWFEFVAVGPKHLIQINTDADLNLSLFAGTNCDELSFMNCFTQDANIVENLIPGQTYKVRVWSVTALHLEISFDISVTNIYLPLAANTTQFTNEQLVTNVLVNNPCVDISNISSSTGTDFGSVNGIGYFTNTNPFFPISSGLVLSTGNAANVGGPNLSALSDGTNLWNSTGDNDLENIILSATGLPMDSRNATKLEFDFTSQNEFMSFNFLFASEEYGTFQCQYADAFAFLLTDLVTGITKNLAVIPGTDIPVSVVTINNDQYNSACTSQNAAFFDTFFGEPLAQTAATNFNGQTVLMSASSEIIANRPYHIKLVIADRLDEKFDSAVFIQGGSFSSGPPQCTDKINLVAFIDENSNGTKEDNESSFAYGAFTYQMNNVGDLNNISSPIGNYSIYDSNPSNSYDFGYAVHPEYAAYFSSGAISHDDISIAVGSGTQTLYFPITQIQGYNDVTVSIVPTGQPTAGFSYVNKVVYTNKGTAAASGTITYHKDPLVTVASGEAGVVNTADGFTYGFSNLGPFETRSFNFTINVPSIPTVNIDDVLESSITISSGADDINLDNNSFTNAQIVVASYDPNDKMEAHGGKLDFNSFSQDDYLFYTIRFQNTGTANAINIRIEDVLDGQLDEESIRMVSASHNYVMERVGNKLVWRFDYIYLPSHLENEVLSNGYLTFMIKVKPGFQLGDVIPNFAEIYFDTNPAIVTNVFTSTFEEQLSRPEFTSGNINVYPNPSNGLVYINVQNTSESLSAINLYDVLGKTVLSSKSLSAKQSTIDVSALAKGVYMIEIVTENNLRQTKKLVVN